MSTPPQTIDLDGQTYTARKYTNKLRAEIGQDKLLAREQKRAQLARLRLVVGHYQRRQRNGEALELSELDSVSDKLDEFRKLERELDDDAIELAPLLFRGPEGQPATRELIDEHADLTELGEAVGIALLEEDAPDPTPDPAGTTAPAATT